MDLAEGLSPKVATEATAAPAAEVAPADRQPPVRHAAVSGALWIGVGFGAMYLLRLVASMILTRLLVREVYALMDVAMVFIQGLHMFADVGISTSIVQSKRGDDRDFLNTAWTLQVLRGLALWAATALIALPVALLYDRPVLMILMPIIGATAALDGLSSTSLWTLRRRLARGPLVALEVGTFILGQTVTISWVCLVAPTVWALVAGSLTATLVNTAVSHVLLRGYRNRLRWDKSAVSELVHFGKWIFFSTMITFLAFQADRLIVPRVSGFDLMGVYGRALSLAVIATSLMSAFCCQLVFPIYSRMHQEGKNIRASFGKVQARAAGFAALLVSGMLAAGPAAVHCLYGPLYHEAGWMLQFLAVGAWFQMLEGTIGASLLALGQARAVMVSNGSRLLAVLVFVPLGYWLGHRIPLGTNYADPRLLAASTAGLVAAPLGDGPLLAATALTPERPDYQGFLGMLLGFIAADVTRYLVVLRLARANGLSALAPDLVLGLLILVISPAAAFAGQRLADFCNGYVSNPRAQDVVLFLSQGALVVLIWGLLFLLWSRGKRRRASRAVGVGA
jgi:O-antigen/teichoic acid export membrane protein